MSTKIRVGIGLNDPFFFPSSCIYSPAIYTIVHVPACIQSSEVFYFSRFTFAYHYECPRFRQMVRKTSGLVSFVPESRLPFVQIKSVRFTGKRPRRAETGIKLKAWKKWNANFRLEYSVRKNRTAFSDVPLLPEIFCWNDPKIHFLALLVHSLLFTVSYFIPS